MKARTRELFNHKRVCEYCKEVYETPFNNKKFCSKKCQKDNYELSPCKTCGKLCHGRQCELCFFKKIRRKPNEK